MSRKVLIADDDQIMLRALEKKLSKYRETFSTVMCEDGQEAVNILARQYISMVVLDLKMPKMDGISLLAHIKNKYPDIPVVIISGYKTSDLLNLAKKKGVVAYISKPFQVDDLAKVLVGTLQKEADGGTMNNVSPVVFLQLMEMERRSCTIRVVDKQSLMGGILYFLEGELIDARMGEIYGIEAAYRIFGWEDVTLYVQNECPSKNNVINSDLQPIIMKAVEMKDEMDEIAANGGTDVGAPGGSLEDTSISDPAQDKTVTGSGLEDIATIQEVESNDDLSPGLSAMEQDSLFKIDEKKIQSQQKNRPVPVKKVVLSFTEKLKNLLSKEVGSRSGLEKIYEDDGLNRVVDNFTELGNLFSFGPLKIAYIKTGKAIDKIVVPSEKVTVLELNAKGPHEKIIRVLSDNL